jgi:hypothetical protein
MYEDLILKAMPRAKKLALSHHGKLDPDDAVSIAYLALVKLAPRFDPSRGLVFWTFAEPRLMGALLDAMRVNCVVTCSREKLNSIEGISLDDPDRPLTIIAKSHEDAVLSRVMILRGIEFMERRSGKVTRSAEVAAMMADGWDSISIQRELGMSHGLMYFHKRVIFGLMREAFSKRRLQLV